MKRSFDVLLSVILIIILFLPILFVLLLIRLTTKSSVIFWSERVGLNNDIFLMPKLRTMRNKTPQLATHLMESPDNFYTTLGKYLRKLSLDEIPQLYSILKGDMSFVGPRPALFNQYDLIEMRTKENIHKLKPGLTGWAQVNGRDDLGLREKVIFDKEYLEKNSFVFDFYILFLTLIKLFYKKYISH